MNVRRAAAAGALAFGAVGVLRGCVQLAIMVRPARQIPLLFLETICISLFWVPVVAWVALIWGRSAARRQLIVAVHAGTLAVVVCLEPAWVLAVVRSMNSAYRGSRYVAVFIGRLDTNLLFYAAIVGAIWAASTARRHVESRMAEAALESALADARLHVLTLQLHPHFLFNTLNLISQLAYRDLEAARRTLANLRALLVQSLALAGRRDVALRDELRFLGAYLEIQQRRFAARLRARIDVQTEALDARVPSLVLQPLVENAIAHGIGDRERGGEIVVTARVEGEQLLLSVADDGVGLQRDPVHEGVGLRNTRLRLNQFSQGRYSFTVAPRTGGGTTVSIALPHARVDADAGSRAIPNTIDVQQPTTSRPRPPRARIVLQMLVGWAAVAMIWTEIDTASRIGMHRPVAWSLSLLTSVVNATIWAMLVPPIIWMSRRFDLTEGRSPRRALAHVVGAGCAAAIHVSVYLGILRAFIPADYPAELANAYAWALWDIVAYAAILSFSSVVTLGARHRESRAAIELAHSRLEQTRIASLRLHLQPGVLLAGLAAIDRSMSVSPAVAERATTRMGDLLRLLLARGDRDTASLGSELASLRAYLDVSGADARLDVDGSLYDAELPSVLLAPLAASLDGVIRASAHRDDAALCFTLESPNATVDHEMLDAVRVRLDACLGRRWSLSSRVGAEVGAGASVQLRVPFTDHSEWNATSFGGVAEVASA